MDKRTIFPSHQTIQRCEGSKCSPLVCKEGSWHRQLSVWNISQIGIMLRRLWYKACLQRSAREKVKPGNASEQPKKQTEPSCLAISVEELGHSELVILRLLQNEASEPFLCGQRQQLESGLDQKEKSLHEGNKFAIPSQPFP